MESIILQTLITVAILVTVVIHIHTVYNIESLSKSSLESRYYGVTGVLFIIIAIINIL